MLVIYQDIIVSVHGLNIFIGFADRRLFCTSEDLVETYNSPASPYCTFSGIALQGISSQAYCMDYVFCATCKPLCLLDITQKHPLSPSPWTSVPPKPSKNCLINPAASKVIVSDHYINNHCSTLPRKSHRIIL